MVQYHTVMLVNSRQRRNVGGCCCRIDIHHDAIVDILGQDGLPHDIDTAGCQDTVLKGKIVNDHICHGPYLGILHQQRSKFALDVRPYRLECKRFVVTVSVVMVVSSSRQQNGHWYLPKCNDQGRRNGLIQENGKEGSAHHGVRQDVKCHCRSCCQHVGIVSSFASHHGHHHHGITGTSRNGAHSTVCVVILVKEESLGHIICHMLGNHIAQSRQTSSCDGSREERMGFEQAVVSFRQVGNTEATAGLI
eukprot:scaffold70203_cov58-Attheya_sp.AAC.1